jgi:hypothetical protein
LCAGTAPLHASGTRKSGRYSRWWTWGTKHRCATAHARTQRWHGRCAGLFGAMLHAVVRAATAPVRNVVQGQLVLCCVCTCVTMLRPHCAMLCCHACTDLTPGLHCGCPVLWCYYVDLCK